ncbi:DNA dC-_dU-editing enzyme APOBEC-3A [Hyaena hyaena]|uniref:DNA dC->dU-editing enzyme APOBEC-3A n=1 Tax=Hyaena hyaena TaxID=95912 RepID=UPI001922E821|nr:DNA dC->dU-editing enzyme APOBEC-3A [Hyaena hyaena]
MDAMGHRAGDREGTDMDAGPPAWDSCLLDKDTFLQNFDQKNWEKKTYLCYEVELPEGASGVPPGQLKGILHNEPAQGEQQRGCHSEMCLLELIQSWELGSELPYKVTCFLSWSPCATCADQLAQFLVKNKHVTLRLFASRLYTKERYEDWLRVQKGYEDGLRTLQRHGAHIAIMTSTDFEHCWETFVDNQGKPFEPWDTLVSQSRLLSERLKNILEKPEDGRQSR